MTRWEEFQFICTTLRASLVARRLDIPTDVDWSKVIGQASRHFVTPMMAPSLVDHSDAPSGVRDDFAAARLLTGQQAKVLRALSAEIVSALRVVGARPVLLQDAPPLWRRGFTRRTTCVL